MPCAWLWVRCACSCSFSKSGTISKSLFYLECIELMFLAYLFYNQQKRWPDKVKINVFNSLDVFHNHFQKEWLDLEKLILGVWSKPSSYLLLSCLTSRAAPGPEARLRPKGWTGLWHNIMGCQDRCVTVQVSCALCPFALYWNAKWEWIETLNSLLVTCNSLQIKREACRNVATSLNCDLITLSKIAVPELLICN